MKKANKILYSLSALVLTVAVATSTWPCLFIFHQPKVPAGIKALRKF